VRLTDSLEFQDASLLESLSNYIHYTTTMESHQEIHGIMSISHHIYVSHTRTTILFKALWFQANAQPTSQSMIHSIYSTTKSQPHLIS